MKIKTRISSIVSAGYMAFNAGQTKIMIDPNSCSIRALEDAGRGIRHVPAGNPSNHYCSLFRIVTPSSEWKSRYAEGAGQKAPEARSDNDKLTFKFDDLAAKDGRQTGIEAEVRICRSRAEDEIIFQLRITNRGSNDITEVVFPRIGGWTGLGGPGKDTILLGANEKFDPHSLPKNFGATYARWHQRIPEWLGIEFPMRLNVPWIDISGPKGGLSYINYMTTAKNGYITVENEAGYEPGFWLAFGWAHMVCIKPGESWTSPKIGIAVHSGDWHETADRYRLWMKENLPPIRNNKSLRKSIGFQNVFFRGFDGEPIRDLAEIPAVAASARKYGVNHISVWDYTSLGNYVMRPECELLDYNESDLVKITGGIKRAVAEGSQVSLLINFRHLNPAAKWYDDHKLEIKRCYDHTPQTENWSAAGYYGRLWVNNMGPECNVYSPFSPVYRKRVLDLIKTCKQLGYASIFYDQPWEVKPDYSFMDKGCKPDDTHAALVELLGEVRKMLPENGIMIGEECDVFDSQYIDMWMSWSWSAIRAAERLARLRYSLPDTVLAWVVDSEPERASLAFALGMHLCICVHGNEGILDDEPALAGHVAKLAKLRQLTAERTTMARFNHQRGITVKGDDNFYAYSYDSAQGPAVIVAAIGKKAGGRVAVDRKAFSAAGNPGKGTIYGLNGEQTSTVKDAFQFDLKANEAAVWIL